MLLRPDHEGVVDPRECPRLLVRCAPVVVDLECVVPGRSHHDEEMLDLALVALVHVDRVVSYEDHRDVLTIDRPSKELHAVVDVESNLNVVARRTVTDSRKSDAVDLIVGADDRASVPHSDITENSGVIIR